MLEAEIMSFFRFRQVSNLNSSYEDNKLIFEEQKPQGLENCVSLNRILMAR